MMESGVPWMQSCLFTMNVHRDLFPEHSRHRPQAVSRLTIPNLFLASMLPKKKFLSLSLNFLSGPHFSACLLAFLVLSPCDTEPLHFQTALPRKPLSPHSSASVWLCMWPTSLGSGFYCPQLSYSLIASYIYPEWRVASISIGLSKICTCLEIKNTPADILQHPPS